jgi:lysophospholipase L1-like esterase
MHHTAPSQLPHRPAPHRALIHPAMLALCLSFFTPAQADPILPLQHGDRITFLGDSITQSGQYIAFLETYSWARHPDLALSFTNLGLSSETANGHSEEDHPGRRPHILDRLAGALAVAPGPDWIFVCYGMNDGIYHPHDPARAAAYDEGISAILAAAKAAGARVVLLTPPPFDAPTAAARQIPLQPAEAPVFGYKTPYKNYDANVLADLATRVLARTPDDTLHLTIDTRQPLLQHIAAHRIADPAYLWGDGIHPPIEGHLALALAILTAIGEDPSAAADTLTRLTGISATPGATQAPTPLWRQVIARHQALSTAFRKAAAEGLATIPEEAAQAADQARKEILATIRETLSKPATPAP